MRPPRDACGWLKLVRQAGRWRSAVQHQRVWWVRHGDLVEGHEAAAHSIITSLIPICQGEVSLQASRHGNKPTVTARRQSQRLIFGGVRERPLVAIWAALIAAQSASGAHRHAHHFCRTSRAHLVRPLSEGDDRLTVGATSTFFRVASIARGLVGLINAPTPEPKTSAPACRVPAPPISIAPYSPDFHPIEMVFAMLHALLCRLASALLRDCRKRPAGWSTPSRPMSVPASSQQLNKNQIESQSLEALHRKKQFNINIVKVEILKTPPPIYGITLSFCHKLGFDIGPESGVCSVTKLHHKKFQLSL